MPDFSLIASSIASAAAASGVTFVVCRGLFDRRAKELARRLEVVEAARHLLDERSQQSRRQVEQLQKELETERAALRAAAMRNGAPPRAPAAPAPAPQAAGNRAQELEAMLREGDRAHAGDRPSLPANGFADTLPMAANPHRSFGARSTTY